MGPTFESAAERVVSAFQRQRPVRAGSLIITLFGDALAPRGGEISLASLIAVLAGIWLTRATGAHCCRTAGQGRLAGQARAPGTSQLLRPHSRSAANASREATRRIYGAPTRRLARALDAGAGPRRAAESRQKLRRPNSNGSASAHSHRRRSRTPTPTWTAIRRELTDPSLLDSALILRAHTAR